MDYALRRIIIFGIVLAVIGPIVITFILVKEKRERTHPPAIPDSFLPPPPDPEDEP